LSGQNTLTLILCNEQSVSNNQIAVVFLIPMIYSCCIKIIICWSVNEYRIIFSLVWSEKTILGIE
jgi:hypothetical protein